MSIATSFVLLSLDHKFALSGLSTGPLHLYLNCADVQLKPLLYRLHTPCQMHANQVFDTCETYVYDAGTLPLVTTVPTHAMEDERLKGLWGWAARRLGIPGWGQLLILALVGAGLLLWNWHSDTMNRLDKLEASVSSMPTELSRDLLAQANTDVTIGNSARAVSATEAATALIARATVRRLTASPDYFAGTAAELGLLTDRVHDPTFSAKVNSARLALAEYRSALQVVPTLPKAQSSEDKSYSVARDSTIDPSVFGNATVINLAPGVEAFGTPFVRRLSDKVYIKDLTFVGGEQTIDGFHWIHVVFINTLIKYDGDEVELQNVRFVNCAFDISDNLNAARIANYVAESLPEITVRSGT